MIKSKFMQFIILFHCIGFCNLFGGQIFTTNKLETPKIIENNVVNRSNKNNLCDLNKISAIGLIKLNSEARHYIISKAKSNIITCTLAMSIFKTFLTQCVAIKYICTLDDLISNIAQNENEYISIDELYS